MGNVPSTIFSALAAGVLATTGVTVISVEGERAEAAGPAAVSAPAVVHAQPILAAAVRPNPSPNALYGAQVAGGGAPAAGVPGAVDAGGTLITFAPTPGAEVPSAERGSSSRSPRMRVVDSGRR